MVYNQNKPDSGPSPALDAPTLQGNFSTFNTVFSANHTPMNDVNQGKHATIIFQNQTNFPESIINSVALLAHNSTSSTDTQPQLFAKIPKFLPTAEDTSNALNLPMQLTFNKVNTTGPNQYQSFLIGGYLINFGIVTGTTASSGFISVPVTLSPVPTKILSVVGTTSNFNNTGSQAPFQISVLFDPAIPSGFRLTNRAQLFAAGVSYSITWVAISQA